MSFATFRNCRSASANRFLLALLVALCSCTTDPLEEARSLVAEWRLVEAQEILEQYVEEGDSSARMLYAGVLLLRGELFEAREQFGRLHRDDSSSASVRHGLALSLYHLGHLDSAAVIAHGLLRESETGWPLLSARAHHLLGLIAFDRGMYGDAEVHQRQSLQAARRFSQELDEANALRQLGVLAWYRGRVDSALVFFYLPALERYQRLGHRQGEATTLSNIGLIHKHRGDGLLALKYQLEAFGIRKQIGDLRGLADSHYFITATGSAIRSTEFMYTHRMKSLELSRRIGYAWGEEVASRALEHVISSDAFQGFDVDTAVVARTAEGRLHAGWRKAGRHHERGEWTAAIEGFRETIRLADSLGYRHGLHTPVLYYSLSLTGAGRFDEAIRVLGRESSLPEIPTVREKYLSKIARARAQLGLRRVKEAGRTLSEVVGDLDSIFLHTIQNPGSILSLERAADQVHETRSKAYDALVQAFQHEGAVQVFPWIERERSLPFWGRRTPRDPGLSTRDAIGMAVRLAERYDDKGAFEDKSELDARINELEEAAIAEERVLTEVGRHLTVARLATPEEVRSSLLESEVLVQYYVAEKTVLAVVTRKSGTYLENLAITPGELDASVRVFRELLSRGKTSPRDTLWRAPARYLFDALIAPLEQRGWLKQSEHIMVAPHKILHLLPFQALLDPIHGTPDVLIQHHSVSVIPSASWLVERRSQPIDPFGSHLSVVPSGTLPFALEEVAAIPEHIFPVRKVLKRSSATVGETIRLLPQVDVAHFAAHARLLPRYPVYSYIELGDDRLELHELFGHSGPRRLVILSACESGLSGGILEKDLSSGDLVSFPRAFLQNGVPAVIASLWQVEDQSAAEFFRTFYSSLAADGRASLGTVFTTAQRDFLQNFAEKANRTHPFYWGSFSLFGDSR